LGGDNSYQYAPNSTYWIDPVGLKKGKAAQAARIARRKAMRKANIPTSRGNIGVKKDSQIPKKTYEYGNCKCDYDQQYYEDDQGKTVILSKHPADKYHPDPHVHVGYPKGTEGGKYTTFRGGSTKYQTGGPVQEFKIGE